MRQLVYVSKSAMPADRTSLDAILFQARHNNAIDGVTGLLWSDGERFAQVIEGGEGAIGALLERLRADPRHHDLTVLHDRPVDGRQFGIWSMEVRSAGRDPDAYDIRMRRALDDASEAVRGVFAGLV